jgi:hypothetical protein
LPNREKVAFPPERKIEFREKIVITHEPSVLREAISEEDEHPGEDESEGCPVFFGEAERSGEGGWFGEEGEEEAPEGFHINILAVL